MELVCSLLCPDDQLTSRPVPWRGYSGEGGTRGAERVSLHGRTFKTRALLSIAPMDLAGRVEALPSLVAE